VGQGLADCGAAAPAAGAGARRHAYGRVGWCTPIVNGRHTVTHDLQCPDHVVRVHSAICCDQLTKTRENAQATAAALLIAPLMRSLLITAYAVTALRLLLPTLSRAEGLSCDEICISRSAAFATSALNSTMAVCVCVWKFGRCNCHKTCGVLACLYGIMMGARFAGIRACDERSVELEGASRKRAGGRQHRRVCAVTSS